MVDFGWSYPAGCHNTPYDAPDEPCYLCGKHWESCVCPECPVCGEYGSEKCYKDHGLVYNKEQLKGQTYLKIREYEDRISDLKMYLDFLEEQPDPDPK